MCFQVQMTSGWHCTKDWGSHGERLDGNLQVKEDQIVVFIAFNLISSNQIVNAWFYTKSSYYPSYIHALWGLCMPLLLNPLNLCCRKRCKAGSTQVQVLTNKRCKLISQGAVLSHLVSYVFVPRFHVRFQYRWFLLASHIFSWSFV